MADVTQILNAIEQGDSQAAEQLLPLVYDELRKLAVQKLAHETPGQTLEATALVHEAYVRLVDGDRTEEGQRAFTLHWSVKARCPSSILATLLGRRIETFRRINDSALDG